MQVFATDRVKIEKSIVQSIGFLIIASKDSNDATDRIARYRWIVQSVSLVKRNTLTLEHSGKQDNPNDAEYWLFELGQVETLERECVYSATNHLVKVITANPTTWSKCSNA